MDKDYQLVSDEMTGDNPLTQKPERVPVSGRREVSCPKVNLSEVEQRICELADAGFAVDSIAHRCRVSPGTVEQLLRTVDADTYRDYLRDQRDADMEYLNTTWQEVLVLATSAVRDVLLYGKPNERLAAAKEIFDRHPNRMFVKASKEIHEKIQKPIDRLDDDKSLVIEILGAEKAEPKQIERTPSDDRHGQDERRTDPETGGAKQLPF